MSKHMNWMGILVPLLVFASGILILTRYLESHAVFFPTRHLNMDPSFMRLPFEDVYLKASDGVRIHAWFSKHPKASSTLIFAHGNAGNISDRLLKIKFFYDLGLNVLIFDYRGYGRSDGTPSEAGIYRDAQAAYDYLAAREDLDRSKIIAYGSSLGGAVMTDLASHRPVAALIVDSSMTSAVEVAKIFYPYVPPFFLRLKFDSLRKVQAITAPKLFIHSPDDRTIPFSMGERLYQAAAGPKEFLKSSGGHNEIQIINDPETAAGLRQYLSSKGLL